MLTEGKGGLKGHVIIGEPSRHDNLTTFKDQSPGPCCFHGIPLVPSANPEIAVVEPNMEAVRCVLQGKTKARPTWKHLQAESCSDRDTVEQGGAAPKTAKPDTPNRPAPTQWPWQAGVAVLLLVAGGILFKVLRR